jgi:hypothetical protein
VLEPLRAPPADPELAEARVAERMPERREALGQDFLAVGDEEQPRTRQALAQAGVIHGGHDGLARARRGYQQVPVMSLLPRQLDLLEEPLLERLQPQLDRAEHDLQSAGRLAPGLIQEDLAIVGLEVAAVPVGLEHRGDLVHHVGIARARHTHVPLQPADLRRVRQVRGADVRGRESAAAVEQPRLGVEPGRAGVVRDPDLGADAPELVQGARLGRASVRRRQHPERGATLAVASQRIEQRNEPGPAHERHDHVDAVGRRDLCQDLAAHARLAGRIGQEPGVEQRDQRPGNRLRRAVRTPAEERAQHHSRLDRRFPGQRRAGHGRIDVRDELARQRHAGGCPLLLGHRRDRPANEPLEMKGDPVRRVGRAKRLRVLCGRRLRVAQARFQRLGDQDLVEPADAVCHRDHRVSPIRRLRAIP